jgi:hypothetical protein
VLVFLGLFLIFFGLVERVYAYPRLKKAPLDQYSQPVATGTGTYFNRSPDKLQEVNGAELRNIRTVRGDVKAGSDEVAVWDSFNSTVAVADNGVITATQERIALDRVTGQSVRCCGENPAHQGLTLKFPFDTKKQSYQFWDGPANAAFPAQFTGQEVVAGVKVYRFEQRIEPRTLRTQDVPGSLAGDPDADSVTTDVVYSNHKTLWVEPATGIIVKAQQDVTQVLRTPGGEQVLTLLENSSLARHLEARVVERTAEGVVFTTSGPGTISTSVGSSRGAGCPGLPPLDPHRRRCENPRLRPAPVSPEL